MLTGVQVKAASNASCRVFAQSLIAEAELDPKIVAVMAAMPDGTGAGPVRGPLPEAVFRRGNCGTACGDLQRRNGGRGLGRSARSIPPSCSAAMIQVVHDVAIQRLPVRFAIDRAGLVGADGATHAGAFDIGFLANLPGMVVMAAADEAELVHMVATAAAR